MQKPRLSVLSLMLITSVAQAADLSSSDTSTTTPSSAASEGALPDNTMVNKRDINARTLTPIDQSNSQSDLDITQAIRKSIMKQDLSTNAKNIKVITQNGAVTLRGPVNSSAEAETIITLAKAVPNIKVLNNQLEVR